MTTIKAKKKEENNFKNIESKILEDFNGRTIRLERILKRRRESLEDFLVSFFTHWNKDRNTLWVDTGEVQTPVGKRRSLGDIYMICKYYYPKCTLKDIIDLLYRRLFNYFDESGEQGFRTCRCNQIMKRVWYHDPDRDTKVLNVKAYDEFGNIYNYYLKELENE